MKHKLTGRHANSPNAGKVRTYASPLRVEQAEQTRRRILQAYGEEICSGEDREITVRQVAARAGVSVPTLYRNFASLEALGEAYWSWIEPQFGALAGIESADDVPLYTERLFTRFADLAPLMRVLMTTRSGRQLRARTVQQRNRAAQQALAPLTQGMSERDALAVTAMCKAISSGAVWQILHDDWGLSGPEAGRAAAWALRTLISSLRTDPNLLHKENT